MAFLTSVLLEAPAARGRMVRRRERRKQGERGWNRLEAAMMSESFR